MKGRLTDNPKCQYTDDAVAKSAQFVLAVKRDFVIGNGPDTDFFQCVAFKNQSKYVEKYVRKGFMVLLRGRFQNNNYEKDGHTIYANQFIVDSVELCESKKNEEEFHPVAEQDQPFPHEEEV